MKYITSTILIAIICYLIFDTFKRIKKDKPTDWKPIWQNGLAIILGLLLLLEKLEK